MMLPNYYIPMLIITLFLLVIVAIGRKEGTFPIFPSNYSASGTQEIYRPIEKTRYKCLYCRGTGLVKCSFCNGRGGKYDPYDPIDHWSECIFCNGTGVRACPLCDGRGYTEY